MTRSQVLAWLISVGQSSEYRLMKTFGKGVQEVVGSLRDLNLVTLSKNRHGIEMWYPVTR